MRQEFLESSRKYFGLRPFPFVFILFVFLFNIGLFTSPAIAATVSLDAGSAPILGMEFSIDVTLDSINDLYGAAYDLKYDPEFLEVVDLNPAAQEVQPKILEGALLNRNGADTTFLRAALENGMPGSVVIGISRSGAVEGVDASSEAVILTATFIPKKLGSTSVVFSKQGLRDSSNIDISVSAWEDLPVNTIPQYGNIDGNDDIDLRDAILILQLASFIPPADPIIYTENAVDVHGKIGIETAVYVLQFIGGLRDR